jgi:two-component system, LytTR family, sensor kinase
MLKKVFDCHSCNEQFLQNEWRWKRITIPIFIIVTTFTVVGYPIVWRYFPHHFINIILVVTCLWLVNRNILTRFHRNYGTNKIRKKVMALKYTLTIIASLSIVFVDIWVFHKLLGDVMDEVCDHEEFMGILIEHRYLFLITLLFAYFINANYERLFLFIELTETGIMAEKYKKDSIESKFNNLKNKINPHFLFNTFNALSEVIEEDPPKASKLVSELTDVYRYVFDYQETNWVSLKREVDFIYSYINLFKMRFEDNLVTDITIPTEYLDYNIAPLTLQILVENAVKHNIISSKKPLKIAIEAKNNSIVVRNTLQLKSIINSGSSFGLKNLKERYKHLTSNEVDISQTNEEFIVKVPLIKELKTDKKKAKENLHEGIDI